MRAIWLAALSLSTATAVATPRIELELIGHYSTGLFAQSAAEIPAYDPLTRRVFVVNAAAATVDVLDIRDPRSPNKIGSLDLVGIGGAANSVAVRWGLVAVAVEAAVKQDPGTVAFFDARTLRLLKTVGVGALPDMLTFTHDGRAVLVANEGEPNDAYTVDPEGSISYIDLRRGVSRATARTIGFGAFEQQRAALLASGVRITGPNASVSQDLEPEYIAEAPDGKSAWVTLQENNAVAKIDLKKLEVVAILPLGTKDHSAPGNALDASDRDSGVNIANWPVHGMYQPDAIDAFEVGGQTYYITANEGDARAYAGFNEERRVRDLQLDATAFPNAATLRDNANLGRLRVTGANGDLDGDGDYDRLFSFGARSFTIWDESGKVVYDSGDALERLTAEIAPGIASPDFNSNNDANNSFDSRSDDKGPEPEGVVVGRIFGRQYAFIGLERVGGVVAYDVTDPTAPVFQDYINNRDFTVAATTPEGGTNPAVGDLGPEGLTFVPWYLSPNFRPLVIVGNEISGTTSIFAVKLLWE
jgi:2',3'-cyclic-nucleotide 2'-phosphodiesterase / 3'-nucleotidase / 5'-nucleotidase